MEYKVVSSDERFYHTAITRLEKEVNELISKGYKPCGGISISAYRIGYETHTRVAQAMIKE